MGLAWLLYFWSYCIAQELWGDGWIDTDSLVMLWRPAMLAVRFVRGYSAYQLDVLRATAVSRLLGRVLWPTWEATDE